MIRAQLFALCQVMVSVYALLAGGKAERRAAVILTLAWIFTMLVRRPFAIRYTTVEYGILAVDALMLAALLGVALTSTRRWPVWMAALQLISVITHLVRALYPTENWRGYQTILAVDSWLILALLAAATATRTPSIAKADPSLLSSFGRWVSQRRRTPPPD
jgi:hypothetical protein